MKYSRRDFIWVPAGLLSASPLIAGACPSVTTAAGEGPFYKAGAPSRAVLRESGMGGTRLMFFGRVLHADCKPIQNAVVDLWHSNEQGEYDNQGFRLRGKVASDRGGHFRFETIQPKGYPTGGGGYRCAHFHLKVHVQGKPSFTTELYFPGDPLNKTDSSFRESRAVKLSPDGNGKAAEYDLVLA
jgi:protocatechuate 3,4-dioxygenase beta subunit